MMEDELNFAVVQNYPTERKFLIKKPLKKSFKDSLKELIMGKG